MSMRVMCLMPVHPSSTALLDAGDETVVELEGAACESGAVDREDKCDGGASTRARPGQVAQRLGARQDPVAVDQRGAQRVDIVLVALDGDDPPGAVIRGEDHGGEPEFRAGATGLRHSTPARRSTTLANAEKSSRPYPAVEAAVRAWRAVAVVVIGTPARAA